MNIYNSDTIIYLILDLDTLLNNFTIHNIKLSFKIFKITF